MISLQFVFGSGTDPFACEISTPTNDIHFSTSRITEASRQRLRAMVECREWQWTGRLGRDYYNGYYDVEKFTSVGKGSDEAKRVLLWHIEAGEVGE